VPPFDESDMYGIREILAIVLSVGLGGFLVAFPGAFIRIQLVGRGPHDRGQYGEDWDPPRKYTLPVRLLGVAAVGVGLYLVAQPL